MIDEREIILDALTEILEKKQYTHLVMRAVLEKYAYLPRQQRGFIKRCCEGTVERLLQIDYVLALFSDTKVRKMKPLIRTILRMGVYQILFLDGVPDSAACNESVKLAKKRGLTGLSGFVNGVLRSISRQKRQIAYPQRGSDLMAYLSIRYSMPEWIVAMWLEVYGSDRTEKILQGLLSVRPVTIRMRETLSEGQREELLCAMEGEGVTWEKVPALPYAYHLQNVDRVSDLPGFAQGGFVAQDAGSMWVVEMAGIHAGDCVIDVCSAPGGKALHAADKAGADGSVLARDLTAYKVSLIRENLDRCAGDRDMAHVTPQVWDATMPDDALAEKADVVIADLPCSGLGVIARKSDIKYRVTQEDVAQIAALQRKILQTVWRYVKKGGVLMMSTCTLTRQENEDNRDWILKELPFSLAGERTFLPGMDASDGFYMAKFIRVS